MADTATLSAKFQISIPKAVREVQDWKAGQELVLIPKGKGVLLIPVPTLDELHGIARGADATGISRSVRSNLMRLVDTSAWIEWLIGSSTGAAIRAELPSRDAWLVPTIVQLELSRWLMREVEEEKADQIIAFTERCIVVPLDTRLALAAAEITSRHKLATADSIIYATAIAQGADVLTCDAHFEGLAATRFVAKV